MKAIILNSGLGKRMGKLTENCHKSMVKLYNGETIFGRQLRLLRECGINEFVVTSGPYEEQLKKETAQFDDIDVIFVKNNDYQTTNYIYSLYLAREYLDDELLLLHGDLVFNKKFVERVIASEYNSLGAVNKIIPKPQKDFKARIDDDLIRKIAIDIFDENCYAFQPFYKLDKSTIGAWRDKMIEFVSKENVKVYAENALNELLGALSINAFNYDMDYVEEVDTAEDLERVSIGINRFDIIEIPVYQGRGSRNRIVDIIKHEKSKNPLIVCDNSWEMLPVQDLFQNSEVQPFYFRDFTANPKYEDVIKGVDLFRSRNCDLIISVGGGSTIDTAKCIKLFSVLNDHENYLQQEYLWNPVKHLAVPTTAGTGSESTQYSVIYYRDEKQSISHASILPDYVILDPDLIDTVPVYHKKASFLDALSHCIESIWSVNATQNSRQIAVEGLDILLRNYREYFAGDSEAADKIMEGANLAGRAINITQTAAAHAFSYKITSMYGIAHGHAVAICLPHIWRYLISNKSKAQDTNALSNAFNLLIKSFGSQTIAQAVEIFDDIRNELGMIAPELNDVRDIHTLSSTVNPTRLKNSLIDFSESDILSIYKGIFNGSRVLE